MTTINARDITQTVRSERLRLTIVLGVVALMSILLSLFLARTIVRPIRRLARAAVRVKLGRAREVVVPRLPTRADELGMLARAVSDMASALRQRIDATEAFAADVTHELKNPLASLAVGGRRSGAGQGSEAAQAIAGDRRRRCAAARPVDHRYIRRFPARRPAQPCAVRAGRCCRTAPRLDRASDGAGRRPWTSPGSSDQ